MIVKKFIYVGADGILCSKCARKVSIPATGIVSFWCRVCKERTTLSQHSKSVEMIMQAVDELVPKYELPKSEPKKVVISLKW